MEIQRFMSGRVAVVTGGSRGIGRAITEAFLRAGGEVVICSRKAPDELPAVDGRRALHLSADVREVDDVEALMASTWSRFGRLDVLVNNAGGSPQVEAAKASPRFSAAIIQLNLLAPLNLAQRANTIMQQQAEGGAIINIASVSGIRPSPGTAAYGAAKAGLLSLTQSLAVEWAPRVRVNAIIAGLIRTEQSLAHYGDEAGIARVGATVPLGRMGTPEDVADACLFLASPMARYMSGAHLTLHGGGEWPAFLAAAGLRGAAS